VVVGGGNLDLQNNCITLKTSLGFYRFFIVFIFILSLSITLFIPSNLLALTQNNFFDKDSYLESSIDPVKTLSFQNELDKYIGIPYRKGGTTEKGFDCSGFVREIYKEYFGIDLPHGSTSQSSLSFMERVTKDELITGDLVFFSTTGKNKRINHVGIYLSDGRFIHAAKGGVTISSLDNSYWKARFYVAKRIESSNIRSGKDLLDEGYDTDLLAIYDKFSSRVNLLSDENEDISNFGNYPFYNNYSRDTFSLGYEISWSASVADGSIKPEFSAFEESGPFKLNSYNTSSSFQSEEFNFLSASDQSSNHGLRLAAAFGDTDDGLSLTPSFTYNDTVNALGNNRLQRYTYGLDLQISPDNKSWLFALGMQYSEFTYSNNIASIANSDEFRSPVNMAFTYLHKLNKSAYLSFTGEVVQRYEPSTEGGVFDLWKNERRSMFLFNYNY